MKKIEDIVFNDEFAKEHKDDFDRIRAELQELDNNKSVQRAYKKFLKKNKGMKYHFNIVNNDIKSYQKISNSKRTYELNANTTYYSQKLNEKYC